MDDNINQFPPLEEPKKNNTVLIIVIVLVALLLCCCCIVVAGWLLYTNGDQWFGLTSQLFNLLA
jgi:hypothetical protein